MSEFVLREVIPCDRNYRRHRRIYDGMPLRPEFRVFYDFDIQKVLYVVNYWDYGYCADSIYDKEDRRAFDEAKDELEAYFEEYKDKSIQEVDLNMRDVQGLDGVWSVDLLLDFDENGERYFWLIDMAVGNNSAYYNEGKIREAFNRIMAKGGEVRI